MPEQRLLTKRIVRGASPFVKYFLKFSRKKGKFIATDGSATLQLSHTGAVSVQGVSVSEKFFAQLVSRWQ